MSAASPDTAPLCAWLLDRALMAATLPEVIAGCGERAVACGLPVRQLRLSATLVDPQYEALSHSWERDIGHSGEQYRHGSRQKQDFQRSPLKRLLDSGEDWVRYRLFAGEGTNEFPLLRDIRAAGATDYIAILSEFGLDGHSVRDLAGCSVSWVGDRPGGFTEDDIAALHRIQPALAVAVRTALNMQIARVMMATYLGHDAGRRVMTDGARRGAVERLEAVLLWTDLRGFTTLSGRLPGEAMVAMLDSYFEAMSTAVHRQGGQVLKFIGDGMLATFARGTDDWAPVCAAALAAAEEAVRGIAAINAARLAEGQPVMSLDLALHLGEVMYGNVGSAERLDFTVIGPAVNEANRIEPYCAALGESLLASAEFVAAFGTPGRFRSRGRFALKGVAGERELFALSE